MTSALRNSLHRRNHKERGQLANRKRLGILEKHSDYVKRARDYHSKQDRLTRLRQKVADRNKDEFYFAMNTEKTKNGVHIKDRGNIALPTDTVKILKSQDENYVRTMRTSNLKKILKLKQTLMSMSNLLHDLRSNKEELQVLKDAGILSKSKFPSSHIHFEDSNPELVQENEPNPDPMLDLGWKLSSTSIPTQNKPTTPTESKSESDEAPSSIKLVKELAARLFRDKQLRYSMREFELQRSMMGKGARKKILAAETPDTQNASDDDEDALDARGGRAPKTSRSTVDEKLYKPRVYKWRRERK